MSPLQPSAFKILLPETNNKTYTTVWCVVVLVAFFCSLILDYAYVKWQLSQVEKLFLKKTNFNFHRIEKLFVSCCSPHGGPIERKHSD